MARGSLQLQHLFRRAGFGMSAEDITLHERTTVAAAIAQLLDYEGVPDDVDAHVGDSAYVSVTARGVFSPDSNIEDARQRWLFRMVHSQRPLQEKMTLFWHNHFATAFSKLQATAGIGNVIGAKMMANRAGSLPGPQGQIETLRQHALGKFRDLLLEMARDPAMLVWLDGRLNTRLRPQENFGREIMELFTFGIGNYTEQDVYAAARVFTGWNLRLVRGATDQQAYYEFVYNPGQHELSAKTFTFPIYADGGTVIPARPAADGVQDGVDLIAALARHPETARRLARKLWNFFISDVLPPDPEFVSSCATAYLVNDTEIRPVIHYILRSRWFMHPGSAYARYSWPAEFVVRSIKEVGWSGYSVDRARTALVNMGQTLFEPPDVNGWELGQGWFSTGAALARMNFAADIAFDQRSNLGRAAAAARSSPEDLLSLFLDRFSPAPYDTEPYEGLLDYLRSGGAWTGSDAQLTMKAAGLTRLIVGSSEYQFM
jgi:uncharacterized protein (DUF1800 family)